MATLKDLFVLGVTNFVGNVIATGTIKSEGGFIGNLTGNVTGNSTTATTATKVANNSVIKFDTGTTEGTDLYTFNGSAAKTIDIKAGTNISLTKTAGTITIANTYTHPTTAGNKHIPSGGSNGQFLGWDSAGTAKWVNNPNSDYNVRQTNSTTNSDYRLLLSQTADDTQVDNITYKSSKLTFNPSSGLLYNEGDVCTDGKFVGTLNSSLKIQLNGGTTEGTNQFTFNNSAGKTINIKAGSNITLTGTAGTITIANAYTHPTTAGNKHVPSGGSSGQFLGWDSAGTAKWVNNPNTDTLVTQTNDTTTTTALPLLIANSTTSPETSTARKSTNLTYTPSTNKLTITGNLEFGQLGNSGVRGITGLVGSNDYWRMVGGATASNTGYSEWATADDGNEPIYVRQYTGVFGTLKRTLTLLDADGDTSIPGGLYFNSNKKYTITTTTNSLRIGAGSITPSTNTEFILMNSSTKRISIDGQLYAHYTGTIQMSREQDDTTMVPIETTFKVWDTEIYLGNKKNNSEAHDQHLRMTHSSMYLHAGDKIELDTYTGSRLYIDHATNLRSKGQMYLESSGHMYLNSNDSAMSIKGSEYLEIYDFGTVDIRAFNYINLDSSSHISLNANTMVNIDIFNGRSSLMMKSNAFELKSDRIYLSSHMVFPASSTIIDNNYPSIFLKRSNLILTGTKTNIKLASDTRIETNKFRLYNTTVGHYTSNIRKMKFYIDTNIASMAFGEKVLNRTYYELAFGTTIATGTSSVAFGDNVIVSGDYSMGVGKGTSPSLLTYTPTAKSYNASTYKWTLTLTAAQITAITNIYGMGSTFMVLVYANGATGNNIKPCKAAYASSTTIVLIGIGNKSATHYIINDTAVSNLRVTVVSPTFLVRGNYSFATGNSLLAYYDNQLVIGQWNAADNNNTALNGTNGKLFIIGNGTSSARKNVLTVSSNGQIQVQPNSVSWNKGRDGANLRQVTFNNYSPMLSMKTTNGSWELGTYTNDILHFSYILDTTYSGNNTQDVDIQIKPDGTMWSKTNQFAFVGNNNHTHTTANSLGALTLQIAGTTKTTYSGAASTFNVIAADTSNAGVVNTTTQTFAGLKTFSGNAAVNNELIIGGSYATVASNVYDAANPRITFKNNGSSQNLQLIFTDYDSIIEPASLTLVGNQGGEFFITPNIRINGATYNNILVCTTAADTALKTVTNTQIRASIGVTIYIKFTNGSTVDNPGLRINDIAPMAIYYRGEPLSSNYPLLANKIYELIFNGSYFEILGELELGTIKEFTKSLTLTTDWVDTGIAGNNLESGSYIVQVSGISNTGTNMYNEIFTGVCSWFASGTNSTDSDEIILHQAGHASNTHCIYLRTLRKASGGYLTLQISANFTYNTATNVTFKFRRLI